MILAVRKQRRDAVDWTRVSELFLQAMASSGGDLGRSLCAAVDFAQKGRVPLASREFPLRARLERNRATATVRAVCEALGADIELAWGREPHQTLRIARRCSWWLLRRYGWQTTAIGLAFGRDHSTIVTGTQAIRKDFHVDPQLRERLEEIGRDIKPVSYAPPPSSTPKDHSMATCACGCGATFTARDEVGRPRRFVSGHNTRIARILGRKAA